MSGQPQVHARAWAIPAPRPEPETLSEFQLRAWRERVAHNLTAYGLTPREREVVWLMLAGLTNKEAAWRLCVSDQTVKNHVTAILRKAGVWDRYQLALRLLGLPLEGIAPPEREP